MLKLAITVIAIALPDCVNPSLIGGELFVATGPRARRGAVAFTLAAWTVTFLFGSALALGLGDLILSLVPKPSASVKDALITAAGAVLLIGGAVIWVRRKALTASDPAAEDRKRRGSPALMGAAGGLRDVFDRSGSVAGGADDCVRDTSQRSGDAADSES